ADDMRALDRERVEERNQIGGELVEIVTPVGCLGAAVTALIVTQDTECFAQVGDLLIPHRQIGGERIAEYDPRSAFRSVDLVIDLQAVGIDAHRSDYLSSDLIRRGTRAAA